jgi:hypothetical protein
MASAHIASLLELAADLEGRDKAVGHEIDLIAELAARAGRLARNAGEVDRFLADAPDELAALDRSEVTHHLHREQALAALAAAEGHLARVDHERRASAADRERAHRELAHARDDVTDAELRIARLHTRRGALVAAEKARRAEVGLLVLEAQGVSDRLALLTRVSGAGKQRPDPNLAGVIDWAARVRAALLVVRGQLDAERDRLVREANELGSTILGHEVGGQSVALIGRRMREATG